MENAVFCQSCAMPMTKDEDFGTNSDNTKNNDYCVYCYKEGAFTSDETMEDMIEACVPHVSTGTPWNSEEEARSEMLKIFPELKRWKKA